ncbi:MAG TPA: ceramidase domain-containing protein [Dongiaceae bacterium]
MDIACPAVFAESWPAMCRAVDHYCERTSPAFDAEPVNALTNLAFPIGAAILWLRRKQRPSVVGSGLIAALIAAMAAVGFGSLLFHVLGTRWAEWGDVVPILVFILLYLWFVLTHLLGLSTVPKAIILAVFFVATFYLEAAVPGDVLWGGALFVPTILVFITAGAVLKMRGHPAGMPMLAAMAVFLCAYFFRSLDHAICGAFPLGSHFMWHLLNALLLFLLIRLAVVHGAARGTPKTEPRRAF